MKYHPPDTPPLMTYPTAAKLLSVKFVTSCAPSTTQPRPFTSALVSRQKGLLAPPLLSAAASTSASVTSSGASDRSDDIV